MSRPSIESLFDATIVLDAESQVRSFSASAEETFGRRAADVTGRPLTDLVPRFNRRKSDGRQRTPAVYADGALFPIEMVAWSEREQTVVVIRDLRAHDLQAAVDEGGWWEMDTDTKEAFWSPRTHALHNVDPDTFTPTMDAFLPLVEPEDQPTVLTALETLIAGEPTAPFEYRLASPPGGVRILRVTTFNDRSREQGRVHGLCNDVTAQRLTRARLDAHEGIANALGSWESGTHEIRALLQHLFLVMQWRVAVTWVPAGEILSCRAFIAETGMELESFEQEVRSLRPLRGGNTLCGQVWGDGASKAIADVTESDLDAAEVASQEGIRGAMAIPARCGEEILAVFEFFTPDRRDLEPEMLDTLDAIGRQLGSFLSARRSLLAPPLLTAREREMLQHASEGQPVREIAERLVISPATVKTHFQNIYGKLGVNDRPAAVALALRSGVIT